MSDRNFLILKVRNLMDKETCTKINAFSTKLKLSRYYDSLNFALTYINKIYII